jgi:hypothetical protein
VPAQTDATGAPAPRRCQRSGQRSRQARTERRRATRVASQRDAITGETATAPAGNARFQDRGFPSVYVAPRRRTSPPPTPTQRRVEVVLAAMSRRSGTPTPPRTTSRPTAPPASCHPPPRTGTRSGTSPACRTQRCSGGSLTPRITGSVTPTTPAPGDTTPRGSALSCSPTTRRTPRMRRKPVTERFPRPGNWTAPGCGAKRASPLTAEEGRHQHAAGSSA